MNKITSVELFTFEPFKVTRIDFERRVVYARFDSFYDEIPLPLMLSGFGQREHKNYPKSRIVPDTEDSLSRYGLRRFDNNTVVTTGRTVAGEKGSYYKIFLYADEFALVNEDEAERELVEGGPIFHPYKLLDEQGIQTAIIKEAGRSGNFELRLVCFSVLDTKRNLRILNPSSEQFRRTAIKLFGFSKISKVTGKARDLTDCLYCYLQDVHTGIIFFIPAVDPPIIKKIEQ